MRTKSLAYCFILFYIFLFVGCVKNSRYYSQYNTNEELISISSKIMLISDNQEHEQFGTAQGKVSEMVDHLITDVTRRPSQQDVFAKYILERSIKYNNTMPIIHLGDIIDISCKSEFVKAMDIFKDIRNPWVLTFGNHDGCFLGNFTDKKMSCAWAGLCNRGRHYDNPKDNILSLNKEKIIEAYLKNLGEKQTCNLNSEKKEGDWISPDKKSFIKRISWHRDEKNPFKSYIIQEVRVPGIKESDVPVSIIILDTSQYKKQFNYCSILGNKVAGKRGEIQIDQANKVREWLKDNVSNKITTIFAGHHILKEIKDRSSLFRKISEPIDGSIFYISGHTHEGGWYKYNIDKKKKKYLYELNLGSINDWPIHYRTLELLRNKNKSLIVKSEYKPISFEDTSNLGFKVCDNDWKLTKDHKASPQKQEEGRTAAYYRSMKNKILANLYIYEDLLEKFPEGDVSEVKFEKYPLVAIYKDFKSYSKLKEYVKEQIKKLEEIIRDKENEDSTINYARLADTINLYKLKDVASNEKLCQFKICQAIQASCDDAKNSNPQKQEEGRTAAYYRSMKNKILANLYIYEDLLEKFPEGDVSEVKFKKYPLVAIYKDFKSYSKLKEYVKEQIKKLEEIIRDKENEDSTINYARLADTINLYKLKDVASNEKLCQFKICQAIQASCDDAKNSKMTLTEAISSVFKLSIKDICRTRFDILSDSEENRKIEYIEIK